MKRTAFFLAVAMIATLSSPVRAQQQKKPDLLKLPEVEKSEVICFALYTVQNNVLKLTAQFYPLTPYGERTAQLQVMDGGEWKTVAEASIIEQGWTAPFRVENWDHSKTVRYRVAYDDEAFYSGTIQRDPVDKETIVIAAFTGNSIQPDHGGDIPKDDIVENIKRIKPDLLFFSGDQVYNHTRHYEAWMKFGREFGEMIKDIPTVSIPDDHDVGQANIWGEGGVKSETPAGHDGGYYMPVDYVQEVHRAQTSHLPDPYDPTPIARGISVFYTSIQVGSVDFAIVSDRMFKTGPQGRIPQQGPRPDHILNPDYDPGTVDVPGLKLLGDRQLAFLRDWGTQWEDVDMKAVLSQTIFCGGAHIHGKVGGRLHADMDSNGWPQTGRNKALAEIRRSVSVHIAGDQHLGSIFHHGIDEFNDACYSFCVPSIANLYLRWWDPLEPGGNRLPGMPEYTGEHLDGFGNKLTCWAAANPSKEPNGGDKLTTRAAGFGVVLFNTSTREITMECWPRNVDITDPSSEQYEGWPKTIHQYDNYGKKAVAYLPTLVFEGAENPVVQVIDESTDEIIYTVRAQGKTFVPKVFKDGAYSLKVGENGLDKTLSGIESIAEAGRKELVIRL